MKNGETHLFVLGSKGKGHEGEITLNRASSRDGAGMAS